MRVEEKERKNLRGELPFFFLQLDRQANRPAVTKLSSAPEPKQLLIYWTPDFGPHLDQK